MFVRDATVSRNTIPSRREGWAHTLTFPLLDSFIKPYMKLRVKRARSRTRPAVCCRSTTNHHYHQHIACLWWTSKETGSGGSLLQGPLLGAPDYATYSKRAEGNKLKGNYYNVGISFRNSESPWETTLDVRRCWVVLWNSLVVECNWSLFCIWKSRHQSCRPKRQTQKKLLCGIFCNRCNSTAGNEWIKHGMNRTWIKVRCLRDNFNSQ